MYKNKQQMITLLFLIILILAIPLIFISLDILQSLKAVSGIDANQILTNALDELYKNITSLPKNESPSTIRKCLTEIFELMNEKEYSKLYSLLTDDIKNLMFPTEESFVSYIEAYLGGNIYSPSFSDYEKLNKEDHDVFIVKTDFIPYSTNEDDIINNISPSISDTFTLYMDEQSNYKFSFLSYIGSGASNDAFINDSISVHIKTTHLYTSKTVFEIELTNKTDSDIFVDKNGILAYTGVMPRYYGASVIIPANSTADVKFTVYTGFELKDSLPQSLNFKGIHINGMVYFFSLPIKYPIKLS